MASGDPPSALARLAEKAARAFEAGDYAEARRCVGDLELEARVGGNSLHSRDAARLAQNVAVLDLLDTEREGRLDAAGFRDTLRRALSAFEASSASDAEPADPEADARESRVLRTNVAWALTRCGDDAKKKPDSCPTHLEVISVLEGVFDETVATDDGCCSTDTLHETIHVASMLTRALAVSGSREDAEKALRILSVAEAMATPFGDADDALAWVLRERARASMALGDLVTAKEALVRAGQTSQKSQTKKSRDELGSLRARLAYLEGDGAAALRAFGERKADTKRTASRDDARTLNLASVLELSGASATASLLLDSMCSRQPRDADADAVTEARTDESDANDAFSLAKKQKIQKTAAYRAGVTLLRAKKPAAAALRVLAGGDAVGAPETFVRLAECACAHAVRGGEVGEDEREAAAAFVAASDGVPLTFSGAQTYLDSAIADMRCDDEDEASSRFRKPRLRAHAHAQRAYVCLALGKRLDALASANEVLALVDAAAKNAKGRPRKEDAKGSAVEEDGFEGGELEAYARLAKTYAAEALTSLGRHEEAAKGGSGEGGSSGGGGGGSGGGGGAGGGDRRPTRRKGRGKASVLNHREARRQNGVRRQKLGPAAESVVAYIVD